MRWLCWWRPPCLLRRVLVNLQHDPTEAVEGLLWQSRGSWIVLRDATALKSSRPETKVVGEIVIHRSNVAFMQVVP